MPTAGAHSSSTWHPGMGGSLATMGEGQTAGQESVSLSITYTEVEQPLYVGSMNPKDDLMCQDELR